MKKVNTRNITLLLLLIILLLSDCSIFDPSGYQVGNLVSNIVWVDNNMVYLRQLIYVRSDGYWEAGGTQLYDVNIKTGKVKVFRPDLFSDYYLCSDGNQVYISRGKILYTPSTNIFSNYEIYYPDTIYWFDGDGFQINNEKDKICFYIKRTDERKIEIVDYNEKIIDSMKLPISREQIYISYNWETDECAVLTSDWDVFLIDFKTHEYDSISIEGIVDGRNPENIKWSEDGSELLINIKNMFNDDCDYTMIITSANPLGTNIRVQSGKYFYKNEAGYYPIINFGSPDYIKIYDENNQLVKTIKEGD